MRAEVWCYGARVRVIEPLSGFKEDFVFMAQNRPDYLIWWYSVKSIALVGALGWVAYLLATQRR